MEGTARFGGSVREDRLPDEGVRRVAVPRPAACDEAWPGEAGGLSQRESEVLMLLAEGLSNREIAARLYLSPETVKTHVSRIFSKLGFRNRVVAATHVFRSQIGVDH